MQTFTDHAIFLTTIILLLTSASASAAGDKPATQPAPGIVEQLDQDLRNLTANLARLDHQLSELEGTPLPTDPTLRALQEVHRAGWQLHLKQWLQQREHLQFAREHLRRAQANPEERSKLREQWRTHEQEFEAVMRTLRREREALEEKHLQLEAALVDRELR